LDSYRNTYTENEAMNPGSEGGVFYLKCDYREFMALVPESRCIYDFDDMDFSKNSA